ncbi:RNA-binding protein [Candidatus Amesbacteria bacterium RIFOXYB1_FULL_47_13]|nr:MAG: RNA-binding protein [Candidatus Amesbacteria bacterium RIFOXYB1_FULL_47_13]
MKLFVGGLSWDTTDEGLRNFFSGTGNVVSASVVMDRFSGKSRGFGFVEMSSDEEAKKAISTLNGQTLDGRTVVVNEARPQAPRDDRSRGDFQRGSRGR